MKIEIRNKREKKEELTKRNSTKFCKHFSLTAIVAFKQEL